MGSVRSVGLFGLEFGLGFMQVSARIFVTPRDPRATGFGGVRNPDATPVDAARAPAWHGPDDPGDWHAVTRTFHDGHTEIWFAAGAHLGWWDRTARRASW